MTWRPWIVAVVALASAGAGAFIWQWYAGPPPKIGVEFKDTSCAIRCPAQTPYAGQPASITCMPGSAPLCQCTDTQKPQAGCVPVN